MQIGYGGNFETAYNDYLLNKYGPIDESFLSMESAYSAYNASSSSSSVEALTYLYCTSSYSNVSSTELETIQEYAEELIDNREYSVNDYVGFTTITGTMKSNSEYDDIVEENRQNIKSHILEYGSVFVAIDIADSSKKYKYVEVESTGDYTLYVSSGAADLEVDHAVSIIGWDDDYSAENFVDADGNKPSEDGAWLALNSWGDDWGNDEGCFWISYEDYWVEYYVYGITEITLEITEDNVEVTLDGSDCTYDGNEKEPTVTVIFEENTLTEGTDYSVSYSDNINAGTATVTITGMGNYAGTITKEFTINKADPEYEVPEGLTGQVGYLLGTIDLPDNFSWDDWSLILEEEGTFTYTVTYTPDDEDNYNTITGIEVSVIVYNELTITINEYTVKRANSTYYLSGILAGIDIETILSNIETNGTITVYDNTGEEITDETANVTSGMQIIIEKETESEIETMEYILIVTGDINGDGVVNSIDLLKLSRFLTGLDDDLSGAYLYASDIYSDSAINNADLLKLARILVSLDEF